jgi:hypothetical protein
MKQSIDQIEIGKSIIIQAPADEVRPITRTCHGRFRVIKQSSNSCVVIRIDENDISLRKEITDAIESLGVFDSARIHGEIQYIRSVVSRYNNENDRAIKVNKINGVATLSENVMARKKITADEFEQIEIDFNTKLELLRTRIMQQ